jgi:hypothetical protein
MREPLALPDLPSDLPDPLAAAIRTTDLEAIWVAISSLPRRQRRALVLREVGGLSYRELRLALGVSQSSVESLLFRARRQVRALVAAAMPLALRDDLARLIQGIDPGSAGLAARAASLPVALKLATAAVSVGLVTTGAAQFPEHHSPPQVKLRASDSLAVAHLTEQASTRLVTERTVADPPMHAAPKQEQENSDRSGQQESEHAQRAEPPDQEHALATPEASDAEPAQVDPIQTEPTQDGGSDSSGSGRSGPSGGNSQPDGSTD